MKRIIPIAIAIAIFGLFAPRIQAQAPAAQDPAAQAQAVADKAVAYLKSKQLPDGGWHGEKEPPGITFIVLKGFAQDAQTAKDPATAKGFARLLTYKKENGSITGDTTANYNTAIAVSALAAAHNPEYQKKIDGAVAYLKGIQWTDKIQDVPNAAKRVDDDKDPRYGGWGYGRHSRPDGSNLQFTVDALKDAGLKEDDPAFQAALKFATRMQNLSETNDQPWAGNDGGFVYTPAGGTKDEPGESAAGAFIGPDGKRHLRSYGSLTYAGLKTFIYAGLKKDDPRVKAAWGWITKNWTLDENPGMRLGDPNNARYGLYYYYMTLARALNAYNEPTITDPQGHAHDWRTELIAKLASLQQPDGSFKGEAKWYEDNPVLVTSYVLLTIQNAQADLKEHPPTPAGGAAKND